MQGKSHFSRKKAINIFFTVYLQQGDCFHVELIYFIQNKIFIQFVFFSMLCLCCFTDTLSASFGAFQTGRLNETKGRGRNVWERHSKNRLLVLNTCPASPTIVNPDPVRIRKSPPIATISCLQGERIALQREAKWAGSAANTPALLSPHKLRK